MSRIGKKPVVLPDGVTVTVENDLVKVKGKKGELSLTHLPNVKVEVGEKELNVTRIDETKISRSVHGLTRALIDNMVQGVSEGYTKELQIVGVGYRAEMKGENLLLSIGYSHPIYFMPPEGVTLQTPTQTQIVITGIDKQVVGSVAAKIRSFRKPEPYKGKGIKYKDEYIRRKAGKTAGK